MMPRFVSSQSFRSEIDRTKAASRAVNNNLSAVAVDVAEGDRVLSMAALAFTHDTFRAFAKLLAHVFDFLSLPQSITERPQ